MKCFSKCCLLLGPYPLLSFMSLIYICVTMVYTYMFVCAVS